MHLEEVGLLSDKGLPVAEWFSAAANIPSQPSCRRSPYLRAGTCSNLTAQLHRPIAASIHPPLAHHAVDNSRHRVRLPLTTTRVASNQ